MKFMGMTKPRIRYFNDATAKVASRLYCSMGSSVVDASTDILRLPDALDVVYTNAVLFKV